ncbi:hypothetical protein GCM10027563_12440 [Parasphingorhabdus pacifica]
MPREHPLHRPRHGRRQLTALVCALLFFSAPLVTWMFGARAEPLENRPRTEFPGVTDGWGFFTGLHPWATDSLPFRTEAVRSVDAFSRGVFGEPAQRQGGGEPSAPVGGDDDANDTPLRESMFPDVIEGENGWLYLGHDVSYQCVPRMELSGVMASLRRWRSVVEASGREFELVIAPDKSSVYPEHLPAEYAGEECSTRHRERFWQSLPDTGALDLRARLRELAERNGRPIYHEIDTHWTHEGGVAMVYQLAEQLESGTTGTWELRPSRRYEHSADIPDLLGQDRTVQIQAYSLAPDGGADNTRFRPSDFAEPLRFESSPKEGTVDEPVRMVGDSFSQFASPYLAAAFSDIAVVHPDTVSEQPERMGELLAEGESVVFELSERFVAGGRYDLLDPAVIDRVGEVLAAHPVE